MTDEIAPLDVRELVEEYRAATTISPMLGARRQHDRGLEDPAGEGHFDQRARHEPRHLVEIESVGDLAEGRRPRALVERGSRPHDATNRKRAETKPAEETDYH